MRLSLAVAFDHFAQTLLTLIRHGAEGGALEPAPVLVIRCAPSFGEAPCARERKRNPEHRNPLIYQGLCAFGWGRGRTEAATPPRKVGVGACLGVTAGASKKWRGSGGGARRAGRVALSRGCAWL